MDGWRIYYDDGTTHDACDGVPTRLTGIAAIWQDQPHEWCYSGDYFLYLTASGCWVELRGVDALIDHLTTQFGTIGAVAVGRRLTKPAFDAIVTRMNAEHHARREAG